VKAPFPWFLLGGKRTVVDLVWQRFGRPKQYIEPFCGSAAMLLAAPAPASLEVICDANYYVANFWRAVKYQPDLVWVEQDYPVSHVDLSARHRWLTDPERKTTLRDRLADPEWPGDARIAGWWVWGQCCWIGSGWCDPVTSKDWDQIPHAGNAGMGLQAHGKIPHASDAGRGLQAHGKIPHAGNAGRAAREWIARLSARLERVRIQHADWSRCLNRHYGGASTAVFLDPPYRGYERLYGAVTPTADSVCEWARGNGDARVALCGHRGDYDLPGWEVVEWSRARNTYGGSGTKDSEAIWFSPACEGSRQIGLDL
jgi:hypothetical protein